MDKSKNSKKKPFKWTRELVRLALNDGWTQQEIAEKCRTQQSIVSAWNKGSKQGTEQQLLPLLNIYGNKIRRNSFKVYWSLNTETMEKTFYRVEGKVILSQAFYDPRRDQRGKLVKKVPELKLVVHHQGADQFRVVSQSRLTFRHTNEELDHSVEDAVWNSHVLEPLTTTQLIDFTRNSKALFSRIQPQRYIQSAQVIEKYCAQVPTYRLRTVRVEKSEST